MRATLRQALKKGTPAIFVTHDPDEAAGEVGDCAWSATSLGRTVESSTPAEILGPTVTIRGTVRGAALDESLVDGAPDGPIALTGHPSRATNSSS